MGDDFKLKCPVCGRFIGITRGVFAKHRTGKGKKKPFCTMSNTRRYEGNRFLV